MIKCLDRIFQGLLFSPILHQEEALSGFPLISQLASGKFPETKAYRRSMEHPYVCRSSGASHSNIGPPSANAGFTFPCRHQLLSRFWMLFVVRPQFSDGLEKIVNVKFFEFLFLFLLCDDRSEACQLFSSLSYYF